MKKTRAQYVMVPEDDPGWMRFWSKYPKAVAKKEARKAWAQLQPDAVTVDAMLTTLEWQVPLNQWDGANYQWAPYPASWLRGRRWEDRQPPQAKSRVLSAAVADPIQAWLNRKAVGS